MLRSRPGRVSLLALIVLLAFLTFLANPSHATGRSPLTQGATGQRVEDLQWLLTGGRPSAYSGVRTLTRADVDGAFGPTTAAAVIEMKRRLGFPDRALQPIAGRDLFEILTGKRPRPLMYIARATKRLKASPDESAIDPTLTAMAVKVITLERTQLGIHEEPWGSNWGSKIPEYLAASGLHSAAPWCMAFQQWSYLHAGFGIFANGSAGVFYVRDYMRGHGWLRAQARPGRLALFLDRLGHVELVERVVPGGFYAIGGNSGNQVKRNFHPLGVRPVIFGSLPGVS